MPDRSHSHGSPRSPLAAWGRLAAGCLSLMALGAAMCFGCLAWVGVISPPHPATADPPSEAKAGESSTVRFANTKWQSAGIQVRPADYSSFTERFWRSGRLTLDESRVAHISPMVEGIVREVKFRFGQDVKAGEVLALLDSKDVGQAKLELVKARLAAEYARSQDEWTQTVSRNSAEVVEAMLAGTPMVKIEKQFKDRTIGDMRQQLMTAYSRRIQAKAHFDGASGADGGGAMPAAAMTRLKADFEAAEATHRALCEEVKFQTGQQVRASSQKLREARTAEALTKAQLLMLGYSPAEVNAMDAIAEGAKVSLYPVRAPFAGTILDMHAVLSERVGPQIQMFEIADLSTLWLQADVLEKDLPVVRTLAGASVTFRVGGETGTAHPAVVFYTGDVVDKNTRASTLRATVRNPGRLLKPGMFVEVELARTGGKAVQLPAEAIQRVGTQPFVFVHAGGDEFRRVDVKLGRESAGVVEVIHGVEPGQPVVVAGGFVLKSEMLKELMAGE